MTRYVLLLRGINVGGNNLIKMTALKSCLEKHGLLDVATYIASGNVLFTSSASKRDVLCSGIEEVLSGTFDYGATVVLRTHKEMKEVVNKAPKGFGTDPKKYRYDAIFLKEPLKAAAAMETLKIKEGVDEVHAGRGILYFSRLISKASQSHLAKVSTLPIYKQMTIRNWNTTTKLLALLDEGDLP
jgi:uncharacterized protein (DUF1697 family)